MRAALLLVVLLLSTPAWAQEPPVTDAELHTTDIQFAPQSQEVLQLRADIERLTWQVEDLSRKLAQAQGLIDVLLRPTTERLQREHQQLEDDIRRAGFVRDEQGRVVRPPQTEAQQAPETPGASKEP